MTRLVIDTNVIVSGFLFGGKPEMIIQLVESGQVHLLTSPPLRRETERILAQKFKWSAEEIESSCQPLWDISENIEPNLLLTDCQDPDDNRVLECAAAGKADCILTGDKVLLKMNPFCGIFILRVDTFLSLDLRG